MCSLEFEFKLDSDLFSVLNMLAGLNQYLYSYTSDYLNLIIS